MNIKLSQHLPKTHTQKILKKEAKNKDEACLVVLIDDKKKHPCSIGIGRL